VHGGSGQASKSQSIPVRSMTEKLTIKAKRPLRHVGQIKLGNGFQQGDHASSQDERRVTASRPRPSFAGCCAGPDWRAECQMA
jgi:hypothetical protein